MKENVQIDTMRDIIIIEKTAENVIEVGSKFYCGCCGFVLAICEKELKFPFSVFDFNESIKEKSFTANVLGLHHKTCGHSMFSFKKSYDFISMENYIKNTKSVIN